MSDKKTYTYTDPDKEWSKHLTPKDMMNVSMTVTDDKTTGVRDFIKEWSEKLYEKSYVDQYAAQPTYITSQEQMLKMYGSPNYSINTSPAWNTTYNLKYTNYEPLYNPPTVSKSDSTLLVTMEDGTVESITREDLIKYICEQKLVRENEVVRKVYERYQVAVKLVRSDDDGDTGV